MEIIINELFSEEGICVKLDEPCSDIINISEIIGIVDKVNEVRDILRLHLVRAMDIILHKMIPEEQLFAWNELTPGKGRISLKIASQDANIFRYTEECFKGFALNCFEEMLPRNFNKEKEADKEMYTHALNLCATYYLKYSHELFTMWEKKVMDLSGCYKSQKQVSELFNLFTELMKRSNKKSSKLDKLNSDYWGVVIDMSNDENLDINDFTSIARKVRRKKDD